MKFMLMLKADDANQADRMPTDEELNAMGRFNEDMINAGILLAGEGLHPAHTARKVEFSADEQVVVDGPFAETKELIAGFWIVQVSSPEEAIEWTRRAPLTSGAIEVRRIFEVEDFDQDNEYVKKEVEWREEQGERRTA